MRSRRCRALTVAMTLAAACMAARAQSPEYLERCRTNSDAAARQAFSGYGESMIDYNFRKTAVGLGASIGTWY